MGSFVGHAIPGLMFLLASIWWLLGALRRIFSHQTSTQREPLLRNRQSNRLFNATHRVTFVLTTRKGRRIPLEALVKIVFSVTGMIGELVYEKQWILVDETKGFVSEHLNNYSHMSMYCMFALSGIVDLLMHYYIAMMPLGLDHIFLSLAFFVEGLLFYFHLHGRSQLSERVHTFVYLISFLTSFVILTEMKAVRDPIPTIARAFLTSLQGSWFFQIAFVLHGVKPWHNSSENIEFISIAFVWHIIGACSLYLLIFVAVYYGVFAKQRDNIEHDMDNNSATDEELEMEP